MTPYFIWKDINSLDMDIVVNKLPPITKPERDIEKQEIRGRDGFLTTDYKTYKSTIKTIECTLMNIERLDEVCQWLDGSSNSIFSKEEDRIYKATIINQIPFEQILPRLNSFIVQLECQPFKYCKESYEVITITKPDIIYNPATYYSKPYLKVYGTGNLILTINNKNITLKNIDNYIELDSEKEEAYKDIENCNNKMTGEFPILSVGKNDISWTGNINKIEIIPKWRYL